MSDVGEVAGAVTQAGGIIHHLLDEASIRRIDHEHQENVDCIQGAFIAGAPDDLWRVAYRLCQQSGHPPTPAGGVGTRLLTISPELLHSMLLGLADSIQYRQYLVDAAMRKKE